MQTLRRQVATAFASCVVLCLVAGPLLAQSQATTGVIEGTVTDESGAVAPGATVAIKNTATNFERVVATDASGRFRGLLLPLGPYRVSVTLSGFSTLVREGIDLAVGQSVNLNFVLKVSSVQEELVVTAPAPVVETTRAEGSTHIDQAAIKGLPNNGRNFLDFTKLTPGVSIVQGPDGEELTINGQKGIQNNVSVDGADFNNPFFGEQRGGQRPAFTFNLDAVKEVVVVAEGANAEFGRSNGGFVNVVTKSGTNDVHGTAHVYFKNDGLSSAPKRADGTSADKFDFNQQQLGFTLGGPIRKDKLFYFVALDYQNADSTKQTDPTRIEQRVVDYFASLGSLGENGSIKRTNDARVFLAKLDWQASAKHLLTLRYNYTWSEQKNGTFDVDSWGVSANATEKDYSHAITGSAISNLSGTALNEFRFQWAKEFRPRPYDGPLIAGSNRPLPDTAFDFGSSYRFGEPFFIPVDYFDERVQFNDNISFIKGSHQLKAGAEFNRVHSNQTFRGFQNGRYIFGSTDGFLNYTQNPRYVECSDGSTSQDGVCPPGASITGPLLFFLQQGGVGGLTPEQAGTQDIPQTEFALFLQDKWQPSRKLTVQYGLRWEMQKQADPITPASDVFYAPFIGQTVTNQFGTFPFPSDGTIPSDYKMFQPRLGISWDPKGDGKTVVRLNAGIFYGRIPGLSLASSRSTNGSRAQNFFRASFFNGFGVTPPNYPDLVPAPPADAIPDHPGVFVFSEDFQNPRTYSGSIGVEREVVPNLAVLVQYNHAKGVHITRFFEGNDSAFGCPWGTGLAPGGTNGISCGNSGSGGLTVVKSDAKSVYDGVTVGLNKRWANNFQFQLNYTLSWDHSDDDNERDPFTYRYIRYDNLAAEYGFSDRDQRHRLNGFLLWQAPGKVNVNLRYSYRSAQPLSLAANGQVSQAPFGPDSDRIRADGSIVERNTGRKDNTFSAFDIRVSREFKVANGNVGIEPIVEVFNLFNSKNLLAPQTTNLIFNFDGTIRAGLGEPRQMQLGLRVLW
jgi:Carboxypeptidase regulatory-like domain/TonB dependent receptor-like, beta-barrel/TonB-dependent Receptor Plug Domain